MSEKRPFGAVVYPENTVLVAGMAKAPASTLNSSEAELMLLVMVLDKTSGRILDAECNLAIALDNVFVSNLLVGHCFYTELDSLITSVQQTLHGPAQKALIVCLKDAYSKMNARSPAASYT